MAKKINKKKNIEEVDANSCLGKRPKGPSGDHLEEVIANRENPQETSLSQYDIEKLIVTVRGEQVLIDQDIARIYGVTTGRLSAQRNRPLCALSCFEIRIFPI